MMFTKQNLFTLVSLSSVAWGISGCSGENGLHMGFPLQEKPSPAPAQLVQREESIGAPARTPSVLDPTPAPRIAIPSTSPASNDTASGTLSNRPTRPETATTTTSPSTYSPRPYSQSPAQQGPATWPHSTERPHSIQTPQEHQRRDDRRYDDPLGDGAPSGIPKPTYQPKAEPTPEPKKDEDAISEEIVESTNALRLQYGLAPLRANADLNKKAQLHAEKIANVSSIEAQKSTTLTASISNDSAATLRRTAFGPHFASGYGTAKAVVEAWLSSPIHRANLLNKTFTEIGVGQVKSNASVPESDALGYRFWVQEFGGSEQ